MLLELISLLVIIVSVNGTSGPQVRIGQTTITGLNFPELQQDFFGGIPYAEPPVGELRFQPPRSLTSPPTKQFNATSFGPICAQENSPRVISEDCLTVNIFRPAGLTPARRLPVLFWVYGGSFLNGGSSEFNGSEIISRSISRGTPIIYVNFNYRLGPLGFPQGEQAVQNGLLNLGLKDQLSALEWVQNNIQHFGGDPSKVTLFGESAGAIAISLLFLNSNIENMARGAIFESGSPSSNRIFFPNRSEPLFQTFVSAIPECDGTPQEDVFSCLRLANTSTILTAQSAALATTSEFFPFQPVIDGPEGLIPEIPSQLFAGGHFSKLPFISGTNRDEGTLFTPQSTNNITEWVVFLESLNLPPTEGLDALQQAFAEILVLYPDDPALGSPFGTGNQTFGLSPVFKRAAAILGDMFFQSTRRQWMDAATTHGVTVFGYHFTDPQNDGALGVHHDSEIPYVYGQLPDTATSSAQTLSHQMTDYWLSFVVSQTPNDGKGSQRPFWPQFTQSQLTLLQLDGTNLTTVPDTFRSEPIQSFNSNPLLFHH